MKNRIVNKLVKVVHTRMEIKRELCRSVIRRIFMVLAIGFINSAHSTVLDTNPATNSVGLWLDHNNPYLAGYGPDGETWVWQQWGIVFVTPTDSSLLSSITLNFQLRNWGSPSYPPSTFFEFDLYKWDPVNRSFEDKVFESSNITFADMTTSWTDVWGDQAFTFNVNLPIEGGQAYIIHLVGDGSALFAHTDWGLPGNLYLNQQNGGGWKAFTGSVVSAIIFDETVVPVPEPETYAMMLAGLGLVGFVARRKKQVAI